MKSVAEKICKVDACARQVIARGWCDAHYSRQRNGTDMNRPIELRRERGVFLACEFKTCDQDQISKGLCNGHHRQRLAGAPLRHLQSRRALTVCVITGCDCKFMAFGLCAKHYRTATTYSISCLQLDAIFAPRACASCGCALGLDEMNIDHDHSCCTSGSCGKCIRGVLCHGCNLGLGFFGDSIETLLRAAQYLERTQLAA